MKESLEPYIAAAGQLCASLGAAALVVGVVYAAAYVFLWRRALRRFAAGLKPGKGWSL